jgi:hypothetical protein
VKSSEYKIFVLVETWLNESFQDTELFDDDWIIFRKDRNYANSGTKRGGGVLIAVHRSLNSELLPVNSTSEQIWTKIAINNKSIILGACYVPPCSSISVYNDIFVNVDNFSESLTDFDDLIIMGDFNRPNLKFLPDEDNKTIFWPNNIVDEIDNELIDCFLRNDTYQISNVKNNRGHQLDLIFSSLTENITVSKADYAEQILKNTLHHSAIVLTVENPQFVSNDCDSASVMLHFDFQNANYDLINECIINYDWDEICSHNDVITDKFEKILNQVFEEN